MLLCIITTEFRCLVLPNLYVVLSSFPSQENGMSYCPGIMGTTRISYQESHLKNLLTNLYLSQWNISVRMTHGLQISNKHRRWHKWKCFTFWHDISLSLLLFSQISDLGTDAWVSNSSLSLPAHSAECSKSLTIKHDQRQGHSNPQNQNKWNTNENILCTYTQKGEKWRLGGRGRNKSCSPPIINQT